MEKTRSTYARHLQGCLGDLAYELRIRYLSVHHREGWTPAINAYRCREHIVICVDLAGVDEQAIEILAEQRRLLVRGVRRAPEPEECDGPLTQVLALEIDQGPFEREITLGLDIEPKQIRTELRNGLLWVYLPVRAQA